MSPHLHSPGQDHGSSISISLRERPQLALQIQHLLQSALQSARRATSLICMPDRVVPLLQSLHGGCPCLPEEGHTQHGIPRPTWSFLGPPPKFMSCCVPLVTVPSSHPPQTTASFFAPLPDHILWPSDATKSAPSQLFWTIFPTG